MLVFVLGNTGCTRTRCHCKQKIVGSLFLKSDIDNIQTKGKRK